MAGEARGARAGRRRFPRRPPEVADSRRVGSIDHEADLEDLLETASDRIVAPAPFKRDRRLEPVAGQPSSPLPRGLRRSGMELRKSGVAIAERAGRREFLVEDDMHRGAAIPGGPLEQFDGRGALATRRHHATDAPPQEGLRRGGDRGFAQQQVRADRAAPQVLIRQGDLRGDRGPFGDPGLETRVLEMPARHDEPTSHAPIGFLEADQREVPRRGTLRRSDFSRDARLESP